MYTFSNPKRGIKKQLDTREQCLLAAARELDVPVKDLVLAESGDGGTIYCYASQAEADADHDGAYAVQYCER